MKRLRLNYPQNGKTWWWHVLVFDSKVRMWDWYRNWCRTTGKKGEKYGGFLAQHCAYTLHRIKSDGSEEMSGEIGMLMFHQGCLGSVIVSHEAVHAALQYMRVTAGIPRLDPQNCDEEEERLAYHISDLTQALVKKFYQHGFYQK